MQQLRNPSNEFIKVKKKTIMYKLDTFNSFRRTNQRGFHFDRKNLFLFLNGNRLIQQQHMKISKQKIWLKKIAGNTAFDEIKSPIRKYVEYEINQMNLSLFNNRPKQLLNLSLGDPTLSKSFRTEKCNLQLAASLATQQKSGLIKHIQGLQQARKAVTTKQKANAYEITMNDVYITAGGGQALAAVIHLLADAGDNFLFPKPSFPLLLYIAQLYGIQPKFYTVRAELNWEADLHEMESLIDDRTKFIVVNDPSNPLGSCWSNKFKSKVLDICQRHSIPLLADQIYETISCDQSLLGFAQLSKSSKVVIFKCSGTAKRYSVPGWRLGWLIVYAEKEVQQIYNKHLKNVLSILERPNAVAESSIANIIFNPLNDQSMRRKVNLIQENFLTLNAELSLMSDHFQQTKSSGAIYAAINVNLESFKGPIKSLVEFCKLLYAEENILILPGTFFGGQSQFIRVLMSCDNQKITLFCQRLQRFCLKYGK